jgi:hypothetical protein
MKRSLLVPVMLIIVLAGFRADAQTADSILIKQTAINYVEGYYTADAGRMAKALSPELVKRIIAKDPAGDAIQNMGYSLLLMSTRKNKGPNTMNPNDLFKADVIIYDIGSNIATVKVVTNKFKFIDYLHLGRINGEWKIVNVLWEYPSGK